MRGQLPGGDRPAAAHSFACATYSMTFGAGAGAISVTWSRHYAVNGAAPRPAPHPAAHRRRALDRVIRVSPAARRRSRVARCFPGAVSRARAATGRRLSSYTGYRKKGAAMTSTDPCASAPAPPPGLKAASPAVAQRSLVTPRPAAPPARQRTELTAPPRKAHQAQRARLAMITVPPAGKQPRPGMSPPPTGTRRAPATRNNAGNPRYQAVIPRE